MSLALGPRASRFSPGMGNDAIALDVMDQPRVAVIVLNYCSLADTLECVEAVRKSDYRNFRLLVIDNGSPDRSGRELQTRLPKEEFVALQ